MNKKEGIKNNFQSLLEKEYYRGVIDLLVLFQTKGFGLRQAFFRYALMDDPKLGIDMGRKIKDFLKERDHSFLSAFVRIKSQYSGCVSSRQHLTNYLTMLREKKIVKRVGRFPDIQYKLTSFYYNELQRMYVIEEIERWNNNCNCSRLFLECQFIDLCHALTGGFPRPSFGGLSGVCTKNSTVLLTVG